MRRRTFGSCVLALAASGTAGCLGGNAGGGGTDEETTTVATPALVEQSLSMTGGECGSGQDSASASFGDGSVTLTGTISAQDRCHVAALGSAAYDADADRLAVTVTTEKKQDVCAQCIADVSSEASFRFEGGLPGSVVVTHERRGETRTVLETARES